MIQLTTAILQNNYKGTGDESIKQLFVQPQQSLEDKIYSSIVVHIAAGFTARGDLNLVQLFHTMMMTPRLLKVHYS